MRNTICILMCLWFAVACQSPEQSPQIPVSERAATDLADHRYQEAAWAYRAVGDTTRADSILAVLENVLKSQPDSVKRWSGTGMTRPYLVYFPNNVWALFKAAGSDTGGSINSEIAAYQIDRLLNLDLAAMVIQRDLTLPNGKTQSGSLSYFIQNAKTADKLGLATQNQPIKLIFFDAVIGNADRHTSNWMVRDSTGEIFAIDHNRTFYHDLGWTWWDRVQTIPDPAALGASYTRFKDLTAKDFNAALKDWTTPEQRKAFHKARATMIRYLDAKGQ